MSDKKSERYDPGRDDEDLSALLDGELSSVREHELRSRMADDSELAGRFAELGQVDQRLRSLAEPTLSPERLAGLWAGLERRLAGAREAAPRSRPSLAFLPRGRRLRWLAPAAAAMAAGLALYLAVGRSPEHDPAVEQETQQTAQPGAESATAIAQGRGQSESQTIELASLSEEEIAIALDYDTLSDFEVIEQLDVLEMIAAVD